MTSGGDRTFDEGIEPAPSLPTTEDDSVEVVALSPVIQRFVLTGLGMVGLILAVTLVLSVLRSGDGDDGALDGFSTVTSSTIVSPVTTSTAPEVEVTTTTVAPTTTTQPLEPSAVFGDFPTNTRLVLWTHNQRRVVIIDVDEARSSELDLSELGVPLVERIIAAGDRLIVQSLGEYQAVDADGNSVRLDVTGVIQAFGDDEIWLTSTFIGDQPTTPVRVDFTGETRLLPEIPGDTFPFGWIDDRLLVGAGRSGGIYVEVEDGYQFVAPGELIASGRGFVLSRVCDDTLRCVISRIDLRSGESTEHVVPDGFSIGALWWLDETTSPLLDAVLGISSELGSPAIWDLLTGDLVSLEIPQGRGAAWSPDGTWVFISVDTQVIAYNRTSHIAVAVPVPGDVDFFAALQLAALPVTSSP